MATLLERSLGNPSREVDLMGGLYKNRANFVEDTLIPHLEGFTNDTALFAKYSVQAMLYVMNELVFRSKNALAEAREIKADNPVYLAEAVIPPAPLADVWGRVFAFTPADMGPAARTAWDLDKFAAAPAADDFKTFLPPNLADNFVVNHRIMVTDLLLFRSRIRAKITDVNNIRKNSVVQDEIDAAEDVQAWLEDLLENKINQAVLYLSEVELGYYSNLGPLTPLERRRIRRKYNWIRGAEVTENRMRPIDRDKVPVPARPLLVRRTRAENIASM